MKNVRPTSGSTIGSPTDTGRSRITDGLVDGAIDSFDLDAPECGFWWYKLGKLEHQFINIRHIQHHTAQLADRLRVSKDIGVPWVGMRHSQGA